MKNETKKSIINTIESKIEIAGGFFFFFKFLKSIYFLKFTWINRLILSFSNPFASK
jgi:hypothetical protein